eukprot:scaffold36024_cov75-Phaeocystis_antarctica.AAC.5
MYGPLDHCLQLGSLGRVEDLDRQRCGKVRGEAVGATAAVMAGVAWQCWQVLAAAPWSRACMEPKPRSRVCMEHSISKERKLGLTGPRRSATHMREKGVSRGRKSAPADLGGTPLPGNKVRAVTTLEA